MARIQANRKNYKGAYKKHAYTYEKLQDGSDITKRLILCYCVESGLKYLIMEEKKIVKVSQADEEIYNVLGSHDFRVLLKAVKKAGVYQFKNFQTEYGDTVNTENYHQLCRYCIDAKDISSVNEYDKTLKEIAEWLKEVI